MHTRDLIMHAPTTSEDRGPHAIGLSIEKRRLALASVASVGAMAIFAYQQFHLHGVGADFLWLWRAVKIVLDGGDPYMLIRPYGNADYTAGVFFYPLPAIGFALPFAFLSPQWAGTLFVGCSAGLLAFAATRDGFHRLPLFLSAPFMIMCRLGQTSGMTMALALLPAAAGLTVMKPNLGLSLFAREPRWRTIAYGAVLLVGSVIVSPRWPIEWIRLISTTPNHYAVVGVAGGALSLLAVLRWRTREGRLLLAMAVIPHALYFYDELPLWLIPRTHRESLSLTWCSWAALGAWVLTDYDRRAGTLDLRGMASWTAWLLYLPCLVMVLRRPNEGDIPTWLENRLSRAPRWLRGSRPVE